MLVLLSVLKAAPELQGMRLLAYVIVASVVLAAISWHWLEKPFMQRARQREAALEPPIVPAEPTAGSPELAPAAPAQTRVREAMP